jgi:hypothetical protein
MIVLKIIGIALLIVLIASALVKDGGSDIFQPHQDYP